MHLMNSKFSATL